MRQDKGASDNLCVNTCGPNRKKIFALQIRSAIPFGAGFIVLALFCYTDYCSRSIFSVISVIPLSWSLHLSGRSGYFPVAPVPANKRKLKEKRTEQLPRIVFCSRNRVLLILFDQAELEIYYYKKATYWKEKRKSITAVWDHYIALASFLVFFRSPCTGTLDLTLTSFFY